MVNILAFGAPGACGGGDARQGLDDSRILFRFPDVSEGMDDDNRTEATLIRYRTHPGRADENQRLIEAVFEEIACARLERIRYAALRLPDSTFYHLVIAEDDAARAALTRLDAFRTFQSGVRERCAEPPVSSRAHIVGKHRMIGAG